MSDTTYYSFPDDASPVIALACARDILADYLNTKGAALSAAVEAVKAGHIKRGKGEQFESDARGALLSCQKAARAIGDLDALIDNEQRLAREAGVHAVERTVEAEKELADIGKIAEDARAKRADRAADNRASGAGRDFEELLAALAGKKH